MLPQINESRNRDFRNRLGLSKSNSNSRSNCRNQNIEYRNPMALNGEGFFLTG